MNKMKKIGLLKKPAFMFAAVVTVFAISVSLVSAVFVSAYSVEDDPLVSLSYITDVVIPQLKAYVDEKTVVKEEAPVESTEEEAVPVVSTVEEAPSAKYEILALTEGQSVYALDSLEIIVRKGGSAVVISPFDAQGIGNMTSGEELLDGAEMPQNIYCVIPRGDGRGVKVTSAECYIMVRGEFEIK